MTCYIILFAVLLGTASRVGSTGAPLGPAEFVCSPPPVIESYFDRNVTHCNRLLPVFYLGGDKLMHMEDIEFTCFGLSYVDLNCSDHRVIICSPDFNGTHSTSILRRRFFSSGENTSFPDPLPVNITNVYNLSSVLDSFRSTSCDVISNRMQILSPEVCLWHSSYDMYIKMNSSIYDPFNKFDGEVGWFSRFMIWMLSESTMSGCTVFFSFLLLCLRTVCDNTIVTGVFSWFHDVSVRFGFPLPVFCCGHPLPLLVTLFTVMTVGGPYLFSLFPFLYSCLIAPIFESFLVHFCGLPAGFILGYIEATMMFSIPTTNFFFQYFILPFWHLFIHISFARLSLYHRLVVHILGNTLSLTLFRYNHGFGVFVYSCIILIALFPDFFTDRDSPVRLQAWDRRIVDRCKFVDRSGVYTRFLRDIFRAFDFEGEDGRALFTMFFPIVTEPLPVDELTSGVRGYILREARFGTINQISGQPDRYPEPGDDPELLDTFNTFDRLEDGLPMQHLGRVHVHFTYTIRIFDMLSTNSEDYAAEYKLVTDGEGDIDMLMQCCGEISSEDPTMDQADFDDSAVFNIVSFLHDKFDVGLQADDMLTAMASFLLDSWLLFVTISGCFPKPCRCCTANPSHDCLEPKPKPDYVTVSLLITQYSCARLRDALGFFDKSLYLRAVPSGPIRRTDFPIDLSSSEAAKVAYGLLMVNSELFGDNSIPLPAPMDMVNLILSCPYRSLPYVLASLQADHGISLPTPGDASPKSLFAGMDRRSRFDAVQANKLLGRDKKRDCVVELVKAFALSLSDSVSYLVDIVGYLSPLPHSVRMQAPGDLFSLSGVLGSLSNYTNPSIATKVIHTMTVLLAFSAMILHSPFGFSYHAMKSTISHYQVPDIDEKMTILNRLITGIKWIHDTGLALYSGELSRLMSNDVGKWLDESAPYANYAHDISHLNFDPKTPGLPVGQGVSCHVLYDRVDKLMSSGQVCQSAAALSNRDQEKAVQVALSKLSALRTRIDTFLKTNMYKAAPFSFLFVGDSAIAKSKLVADAALILQVHADLPTDPIYNYTMPVDNNFMDGFKTSHHTVILDDVGAARPGPGVVDRTVQMIIALINNIPFAPEAANVALKGALAWVGKLVIATANQKHMNVHAYFATPIAVIRRLPLVVNVTPKSPEGHSLRMGEMTQFGTYEAWNFVVERVKLQRGDAISETKVVYEPVLTTGSFVDLMKFLCNEYDVHMLGQASYLAAASAAQNMSKCPKCAKVSIFCECPVEFQSLTTVLASSVGSSVSVFLGIGFVWSRIQAAIQRAHRYMTQTVVQRVTVVSVGLSLAAILLMLGYLISTLQAAAPLVQHQADESDIVSPPNNMWVRDKTTPNLSQASRCISNDQNMNNALKGLIRCVFNVTIHWKRGDFEATTNTHACVLGGPFGSSLLINSHALGRGPLTDRRVPYKLEYNYISSKGVLHEHSIIKREVSLSQDQIISFPDCDVSVVIMKGVSFSPKGIYQYLLETPGSHTPLSSFLLGFDDNDIEISSTRYEHSHQYPWHYNFVSGHATREGDCGRPLFARYPSGCAVLGIHTAGNESHGESSLVTKASLERYLSEFQKYDSINRLELYGPAVLQCYDIPDIELEDGNRHTGIHRDYGYFPTVDFLGCTGQLSSYSSSLCEPIFRPFFQRHVDGQKLKIPPNLNPRDKEVGWKPKHRFLTNVNTCHSMDQRLIDRAVSSLSNWLGDAIEQNEQNMPNNDLNIGVLSVHQAINGIPSVEAIEGLDMRTGYGFPENTPKVSQFISSIDEEGRTLYSLKPQNQTQLDNTIMDMSKGIPYCPIFRASRKDEPISKEKLFDRGPRLIFAAHTIFTILIKRYFGALVRLLFRARHRIGIAVGMNATSVEWHHLYCNLSEFGDNCIAGDFSNFDQKLPHQITLASVSVIGRLNARLVRMSSFDRFISRMVLHPLTNFLLLLDRDIFDIQGPNPSGQGLTTQTNCISVLLLALYVWQSLGHCPDEFFLNVRFTTYGDDHIFVVKPGYEDFNYDAMARVLEPFNIGYTTFDKREARGKTYDSLLSVEFLKRKFTLRGGIYVAQLNRDSIIRRLYIGQKYEPSVLMSCSVDVLSSIWNDSLLHGDMADLRSDIRRWLYDNGRPFCDSLFPSWDDYVARFNYTSQEWATYYGFDCPLLY